MRRYTVQINQNDYVLDVEDVTLDSYVVHLADGQALDVRLTGDEELAQAHIAPQAQGTPVRRSDPPPLPKRDQPAGASRRPVVAGGATAVTAPMPGVVLSVEIAEGDSVTRGQTMFVLEAMKMKNEIKADRDGVVRTVAVKAGDQVAHGNLLAQFED